MKDAQIQKGLATLMVTGVLIAGSIILAGTLWYLTAHPDWKPGDHLFSGEPKYFETITGMFQRALEPHEVGRRRSVVMIGIVLLLLNPLIRVAFAAAGFAVQRDRLYTGISLFVLAVLLFSFFW